MAETIAGLSEREKETLRLLLRGHDAKSIARHLGLSVHTINERLRDAWRKLGVSSSREAARLLAEAEHPESLADKDFGVGDRAPPVVNPTERKGGVRPIWIGGGIIMVLIIAAALLASGLHGGAPAATPSASASESASAEVTAARDWLALVDAGQWEQSWAAAGTVFKSAISAKDWALKVVPVRGPLGAVTSRALKSATKTSSLPGAPDGEYEVVQFSTSFAHKKDATETMILAHEGADWKVDGYFIR